MGKKFLIAIIVLLLAFGLGYALARQGFDQDGQGQNKTPIGDSNPPPKVTDPIEEQIAAMSMAEKIGQLVIVGMDGYELDDSARSLITEYQVGGFILFKRNLKSAQQMVTLLNSLKSVNSVNKVPLFLSIDGEGGRIDRLPGEFIKIPTNRKIGRLGKIELSSQIGGIMGKTLKAIGFNMNFAPVLDIDSNPKNPVIGDRSFGATAEIVSSHGVAMMKGLQDEKVISVVKHFPGHGDTTVDSHIDLPSLSHDLDRLQSVELVPFGAAIQNNADGIMIAHILLRAIDPEYPSSLSYTIITKVLREQMKFEGVVFSDDLTMGAILDNYDIGEAAVRAISAGSDVVLVCHNSENAQKALLALEDAVKTGYISEERLEQSVYRILKLKEKYQLRDEPISEIDVAALNANARSLLSTYPNL